MKTCSAKGLMLFFLLFMQLIGAAQVGEQIVAPVDSSIVKRAVAPVSADSSLETQVVTPGPDSSVKIQTSADSLAGKGQKSVEEAVKKTKEKATNVKDNVQDVGENVGDALNTFTHIISLRNLFTVLFVLLFTWLLIKLLNWLFAWSTIRFNQYRLRILRIQPVVFVVVWSVMLYALVETLFDPTQEAIFAVGASSALALGFAAQDVLKNVFGGLLILFDRPFQIGDRITVKGNYGEVTSIGLRTTRIRTLDDSMVTIPNAMVMNDGIANANSGALDCMVVVDLWLPIGVNGEQVRKIAYEAAITSRYLNIDKPVVILFFDHFDQEPATNVKVKAYVLDARYEKAFEGDVTEAAKKGFGEAGIYS